MTSDRVVSDLMLPLWEEVLWPFLDALGQCASAHNRHAMECPKRDTGRTAISSSSF